MNFISKDEGGKFSVGYVEEDLGKIIDRMIINQNENIELIEKDGENGYKSNAKTYSIDITNEICSFLNIKTTLSDTEEGFYYIKIKY